MLSKNNIWRFKVLGGDGKAVATGEDGESTITMKGPATKADLIRLANILLTSRRRDAVDSGLDDPGYTLDEASIEPLGHTDADIGAFRPAGAKQLTLPTDPVVREKDRALIAEKLGLNADNS